MSTWREKVAAQRPPSASGGAAPAGEPAAGRVSKNARRGGAAQRAKRAPNGGGKGKGKGAPSLRGQIRGLRRTLAHRGEEMTPAARAAKEAEIEGMVALADDRARRERERELAKKYHMVKFFERRKLQRRLEKLAEKVKKNDAAGDAAGDAPELAERKMALEADLFYVQNFPKDKPYVALFPSAGHTDESRAEVEKMREVILAAGGVSAQAAPTTRSSPDAEEESAAGAAAGASAGADVKDGEASSEGGDDFFLDDG